MHNGCILEKLSGNARIKFLVDFLFRANVKKAFMGRSLDTCCNPAVASWAK
jgi:hypothetical protein